MPEPLSDVAVALLRKPNPAVIACNRPDGQPVTVATWYVLDGDRVAVSMDHSRRRLEYLRQDPRVSLTVLDLDGWQTHVTVQGRVVELRDDDDLVEIDRIARHYTGQEYFNRDSPRVTAWIELDHWHGWGKARQP